MNKDEKTVIVCAFRYASVNDLEDVQSVIDALRENIGSFDTDELRTVLSDVHFSLQFLKNHKEEMEHIRTFGNLLKATIEKRSKEEGVYSLRHGTEEMTHFNKNTEFCRFLFALAFAYAAPRHTYMFSLLDDISKPFIKNFTTDELMLISLICQRNFPNEAFGGSSDQATVMNFVERLKTVIQERGVDEDAPTTYLTRAHLVKKFSGEEDG